MYSKEESLTTRPNYGNWNYFIYFLLSVLLVCTVLSAPGVVRTLNPWDCPLPFPRAPYSGVARYCTTLVVFSTAPHSGVVQYGTTLVWYSMAPHCVVRYRTTLVWYSTEPH